MSETSLAPSSATSRSMGYLLLFSGMAVVGTYVALSKPLTAAVPVFLLAWLRFAIAAVAMIAWSLPQAGDQPITRAVGVTLFWQSFFGNFLFSIFMLFGVSMTSATAAGVILGTLPAVVAVLSWLFLREHLTNRVWLAVALAMAGVVLLTLARQQPGTGTAMSATGNVLVFACAICEAIYVILGKRLTSVLSPKRISALINLWGLALMTPFGLWQAASFDFGSLSAQTWLLLVFYSLAASSISTWLWLSGMKHVPANQSGVFTIAMPVSACVVSVLFLGESFTPVHAFAFVCAVGGIALITWPRRTPAVA